MQTSRDEETRDDLLEGVGRGDVPVEPRRRRRERKRNRRILIAALIVLLLPVLAVGGYLVWLNQIVANNIKQEDLLPGVGALPTNPDGATVAQPAGNGTNYLIIGNDAGPDRVGARSDVMVLVHVPENRAKVQLIHFPRDLWVPIPGKGEAKLNASYAYGGAPLLVRTMQNMLGIQIDHVAMLGFEDFKAITDAVGGVDVMVEEASKGDGKVFRKGIQHMDGETALVFVRQRYMLSEGDISRGKRQMAFIEALMQKTLSKETLTNPVRLKDFIDAATENLTVDKGLDVGTMRGEAFAMRNLRPGDIVRITAPFTGFGTSADGQSIDIVDKAKMKELGEALRTDQMDTYVP